MATEQPAHQMVERATELVDGIARDTKAIIDGYLELARFDLRVELSEARSAAMVGMVSIAVLGVAAVLLLIGLCLGLARALAVEPWLSFTAVGAVCLAIGAAVVRVSRRRAREVDVPDAIIEAKEDATWLVEQM